MKFKGVVLDDVFKVFYSKDGTRIVGFAIGDRKLPDAEVQGLKNEAEVISNSLLWKLLSDRAVFAAQVKGIDNAQDFADTREARGMISAVSVFQEALNALHLYEKADKPN